jgi:PleD family two-component response regulator
MNIDDMILSACIRKLKQKPSHDRSTAQFGGVKVLLVDDELDTRNVLRTILEQRGAEVRDAASAEGALREATEWKPSIVVADIGCRARMAISSFGSSESGSEGQAPGHQSSR